MNLSRKWLEEFVHVDASDKEFAEAMTLSGSKVELTHDLGAEISNAGGGQGAVHGPATPTPTTCGSARWTWAGRAGADRHRRLNVHVGDLVPAALHKSTLPGGKKIEKGKLRGEVSNGMLCGPVRAGPWTSGISPMPPSSPPPCSMTTSPWIPISPPSPQTSSPVTRCSAPWCAPSCWRLRPLGDDSEIARARTSAAPPSAPTPPAPTCTRGIWRPTTPRPTATAPWPICGPRQAEFPHCIPDGIFILREDCKPGDDIKPVINADDHVVEFEITPL